MKRQGTDASFIIRGLQQSATFSLASLFTLFHGSLQQIGDWGKRRLDYVRPPLKRNRCRFDQRVPHKIFTEILRIGRLETPRQLFPPLFPTLFLVFPSSLRLYANHRWRVPINHKRGGDEKERLREGKRQTKKRNENLWLHV